MCRTPINLWAAKNLSAIIPIKKGEIIVAIARALYTAPICIPVEPRNSVINVPIVTYHDPQMKYCRNIIKERTMIIFGFIVFVLSGL
jgi:hypothetical protein